MFPLSLDHLQHHYFQRVYFLFFFHFVSHQVFCNVGIRAEAALKTSPQAKKILQPTKLDPDHQNPRFPAKHSSQH